MLLNKISGVLVLLVISTGCSTMIRTNPVPHQVAQGVPQGRLMAFTEPNPNYAKMIVTRDSGVSGSGCYIGLVIDGNIAARFAPEETATFYVPSDVTEFAVVSDPFGQGLCSISGWEPVAENYILQTKKPNRFRINFGLKDVPRLLPTVY